MASIGMFPGTCGVQTMWGIRLDSPEGFVESYCHSSLDADTSVWDNPKGNRNTRQRPFVVFTGVTRCLEGDSIHGGQYANDPDYCNIIADYIMEQGLGLVIRSSERESWTRNMMIVCIWEPDWDALRAWVNKRKGKVPPVAGAQAA